MGSLGLGGKFASHGTLVDAECAIEFHGSCQSLQHKMLEFFHMKVFHADH
jgi:hypothetical protein